MIHGPIRSISEEMALARQNASEEVSLPFLQSPGQQLHPLLDVAGMGILLDDPLHKPLRWTETDGAREWLEEPPHA
jgi:hypothetical protein